MVFFMLVVVSEILFLIFCLVKRSRAIAEARVLWLFQAAAVGAYYLCSPHATTFQWTGLLIWMVVLIICSVFSLLKMFQKNVLYSYRAGKVIGRAVLHSFIWLMVSLPLMLFPPYEQPASSGSYTMDSKVYTWTDSGRTELLAEEEADRKVTVTFYYPVEKKETSPLILFSHGAFGFEKSNYSTYAELVSNGYVVCSISHTYHAFFTKEEDGTVKLVNMDFMQEAMDATNGKITGKTLYELEQKWMAVRTADVNFVLDNIESACSQGRDVFFKGLDLEHIGMFGHSMGGAAAVEIARERKEIDAIVVLDGTFIGEYVGYENGQEVFNEKPLQTSVLNMQSADTYDKDEALGDSYVNNYVLSRAKTAKDIVIEGTGHMNFTDLPMVSPVLAGMLGTGERDAFECTEIINGLIEEWFDCYLKGAPEPKIRGVY